MLINLIGVTANILNAYCFICNNYNFYALEEGFKDEIILVGFSRGAFTVRCLAAFISDIGLLRRQGLNFLPKIFEVWLNGNKQSEEIKRELKGLLCEAQVKILAEWDPVGAMGLPFWPWPHKLSRVKSIANNEVPSCVNHAFLAFALNEKRPSFVPMLWTGRGEAKTKVKQCAFLGCHSDVGGGNLDAGLSTVSLLWMISRIKRACGAQFDDRALLEQPTLKPTRQPAQRLEVRNSVSTKGKISSSSEM